MPLRNGVSILFERHAQALLGSLGLLARQPFATFLTILVIGIALALPAALYVAVANMRVVTAGLDDTVQLSAYLEMGTTPAEASARAQSIAGLPGVATAETVTPNSSMISRYFTSERFSSAPPGAATARYRWERNPPASAP